MSHEQRTTGNTGAGSRLLTKQAEKIRAAGVTGLVASKILSSAESILNCRHCCLVVSLVTIFTITAQAENFYISPEGNDAWSGTLPAPDPAGTDGPVATLEQAQLLAREALKDSQSAEPVHVFLRAGRYELKKTITFTTDDSGTEMNPVVWSGFPGEVAEISGGQRLKNFTHVTSPEVLQRLPAESRQHVMQTSLTVQGISDFGEAAHDQNRSEIFFRRQPMTLARWPDEGFVAIKDILNIDPFTSHGIKGDKTGKFVYDGDRPGRWLQEPDAWLSGYWFWDWSDARQRIQKIDPAAGTIELQPPHHHYGFRRGQRYYAFNLLAELDTPGEWYLDRQHGVLYFWPPVPGSLTDESLTDEVDFSVLRTLLSLENVSHLTIRGLLLENTRGTAVTISGGQRVVLSGCHIQNTGGWGVSVSGMHNGVQGCDIHHTGEGGISLAGGERTTLTPGSLFADNNHIHHFARLVRTYRPAVSLSGVGHRAAHNHIHDAPHNAIQLTGNDHLIEFNDVHHVCQETGDVGAFYMGRDWTMRGNMIRHNFFHHILGPGLHGAMAVYLDDAASGTTIFGNVFYQASRAAFIGGGRDNIVENNIFVDCQPSVHVDARGLGWMHETVEPGGIMPERLAAMPFQTPPWSSRYPELVNILNESPAAPKGNRIVRNISIGGRWKDIEPKAEQGVELIDNLVDIDPHFVDAAAMNFSLQPNSPAWSLGFQPIPISDIGLLNDDSRSSIPNGS